LAKKSRDRNRPATVPKVTVAPASPDGPNRKVRKEEARQQREAIQRRMARRRTYRIVALVLAVLVIAGATTFVLLNNKSSTTSANSRVDPATLPGIMRTSAPWNPEFQDLSARLKVLGLPIQSKEALVYHIHQELQIFINGKAQPVPVCIGIYAPGTSSCPDEQGTAQGNPFLTIIHTHDGSGIIHVESAVKKTYTLGDVFDVWGLYFTKSCIGTYCTKGDQTLRVFLNGKPYAGDPASLPLVQHELIVVTFGTQGQLPKKIPATYSKSLSQSCAPSC
jgi:hypothetical protein